MARSMTVDKRENEKKRLAKRAEKQKRKEEKKLAPKANSFEDMIAYVDENGVITSTPPTENVKKEKINQEEIMISIPKKEKEEPVILKGKIDFFNTSKGFGFIKEPIRGDRVFFHVNNLLSKVEEGDIVTFDLERGLKGMNAVNVRLENESNNNQPEGEETESDITQN